MKLFNSKMHWTINNMDKHDSAAQNSIWHCLAMLSNFEAVKVEIDGFKAEDVVNGEKEFYLFIKTLYQDMYNNPSKYAIPTVEYDDYITKNKIIDKIFSNDQSGHTKNDSKEGKLRNAFQDAIHFFPDYFYKLGLVTDGLDKNYALIIRKSKYDDVLKSLDSVSIRKENNQRLNALMDMGISVNEKNDRCFILCEKYPKMFLGLRIFCVVSENEFKYFNYLRLDFRGFYGYIPQIRDVKMTLVKNHVEILNTILPLFDNSKIKTRLHHFGSITSNHKWKVEYYLNNKKIFELYAGPAYLLFHVFFKDFESLTEITKMLIKEDPNLFNWLDNKFRERKCNNCPRNKTIMFGNKKKQTCGGTSQVEIFNPGKEDAKNCIVLMKMLNGL